MAKTDGALAGFSDSGEGFGQDFLKRFPFCQAATEHVRFSAQGFVAQCLELWLVAVDLIRNLGEFIDGTFVGVAPEKFDEVFKHKMVSG